MAKYSNTKAKINEKITTNGAQAVTGIILNDVLQTMVDSLGADYQFGGLVQPGSSFTAGEQPVVFLATTPGTYTNFGGLVVADGEVALLVWSGSAWSKQTPDIATRTEVGQLGQDVNILKDGVDFSAPLEVSFATETSQYRNDNGYIGTTSGSSRNASIDISTFSGKILSIWQNNTPSTSYERKGFFCDENDKILDTFSTSGTSTPFVADGQGNSSAEFFIKPEYKKLYISFMVWTNPVVNFRIGDGVITTRHLEYESVTNDKIADKAVTIDKTDGIAAYSDIFEVADTTDSIYFGKGSTGGSNVALTIGNNIPSPIAGMLYKVKCYCSDKPFYVEVVRKSGNTFTVISSQLVTPVASGFNEFDLSLSILQGDYVFFAQKGDNTQQIPYRSESNSTAGWDGCLGRFSFLDVGGTFETLTTLGSWSINASYLVKSNRFLTANDLQNAIKTTYLTATRNNADYNSIRELMATLNPSYTNRYEIKVPIGRWRECDLIGKDYVKLVGQDMFGTVIFNDGNSDLLTPDDYSFPQYGGVALNSIDRAYRHIINQKSALFEVQNITLEGSNVKYCAHLDSTSMLHSSFKNCRFIIVTNVPYCVGIGSGTIVGEKTFDFDNCEFLSQDIDRITAIYFHNWNNVPYPSRLTVKDSYFNNMHFATVSELGSEEQDTVQFLNCFSSRNTPRIEMMVENNGSNQTYWTNPATGTKETDPTKVPYCIKINGLGSNIAGLMYREFTSGGGNPRPNMLNYCFLANKVWLN